MTTEAPDRLWSGIDITKVLGGALAAVCAAVAGSFLGVAGTLVGAAVASVIGSIGTEIYSRSINKGTKKLQTLAPAFVKAPAAVGTPPVEAATDEDSPSHTVATADTETGTATDETQVVPPTGASPVRKLQIRWKRVALAAGVLFVLAMSAIFLVELMAGKSVASMVGHGSSGGTTLTRVGGGNAADETPAPVVSVTPTDDATTPSDAPTSTAPTTAPDSTPAPDQTTAPNTDAPTTEAPAPDAPQQTAPPGGSTENQPGTQQQQQQDSGTE